MSRPHGHFQQQQQANEPITPRRLELSLNPEDGSLQTAPLLNVLLAATDGLYSDLYNMAHGELEVTSAQPIAAEGEAEDEEEKQQQQQQQHEAGAGSRKERMSNLSFAQRRHELAWRLAQHGKTLTHVSALTAAAASSDIATATRISTKALQHARTAWVQADEAQDALYFFHAQLFPARQAPHDVYGALDVLLLKSWVDLPTDLKLLVDRYENSQERTWSSAEVADRWHMAVRDKLLRGEVGWMRQRQEALAWNISLRGGIVRLTHGSPKILHTTTRTSAAATVSSSAATADKDGDDKNTNTNGDNHATTTTTSPSKSSSTATANATDKPKLIYPIEAVLTVLSTSQPTQWTLVSVEVHAQAKTGESNHQLDTTNRQRYDLHRLCALAMAREEARQRKVDLVEEEKAKEKLAKSQEDWSDEEDEEEDETSNNNTKIIVAGKKDVDSKLASSSSSPTSVARPLQSLFHVANSFALSWQLEILSAQAHALRKGVWAERDSQSKIVVTPVEFFDMTHDHSSSSSSLSSVLGIVSISFWSVDDRYGPPCMGDLSVEDGATATTTTGTNGAVNESFMDTTSVASSSRKSISSSIRNRVPVSNQFTLSVRAETEHGIQVSLSGASSVMEFARIQPHTRSTIHDLLQATSNPFALSASEALLAATRLCAERKCHAVVQALQPSSGAAILPPWIKLSVERGTIAVAARISYHGVVPPNDGDHEKRQPVVLFRLTCDARTGSFVSTFSRSARLLQFMACNDMKSAEASALRMAQLAQHPRASAARRTVVIGRAVRDAFDGLSRSMNVLGQRTGVGGTWQDVDSMSTSLRQRAISLACSDVRVSMITSCGMAAMYGLSVLAIGVATGVAANAEMYVSGFIGATLRRTFQLSSIGPSLSNLTDRTIPCLAL
jgi:hypothetical protein